MFTILHVANNDSFIWLVKNDIVISNNQWTAFTFKNEILNCVNYCGGYTNFTLYKISSIISIKN